MAQGILVIGDIGSGKTQSIEKLDPKTNFYINTDGKITIAGFKENYNKVNKNYAVTSDLNKIEAVFKTVSKDFPQIRSIVVDTINSPMNDLESLNMNQKGHDKWINYAKQLYDLTRKIPYFREDLYIIYMGHVDMLKIKDVDTEVLKLGGNKLRGFEIEGLFSNTFYSYCDYDEIENTNEFYFMTKRNSTNRARTVLGAFEERKIPNDLRLILDRLDEVNGFKRN